MYILCKILISIGLIVFGVVVDRLWIHFKRKKLKCPVNPLPTIIPKVEGDSNLLQLYLQEWQVIINTQMHFNDLILRFRSIVLTAFVTLIGATIAIGKIGKIGSVSLSRRDVLVISALPAILWITAFIIDFFYYHRMLLGSVTQALKFDKAEKSKSYGLFGMTTCINEQVHSSTSEFLVLLYYFIPLVGQLFYILML